MQDQQQTVFAMKVVQTTHRMDGQRFLRSLVESEYARMLTLTTRANPVPVVMGVVPASKHVLFKADGEEIGIGYLMSHVGTSIVPAKGRSISRDNLILLLLSLATMHRADVVHCDARIQNAVRVGTTVQWIDFLDAMEAGPVPISKKRADVETFLSSVFAEKCSLRAGVGVLLDNYALDPSDINARAIATAVNGFQKIKFSTTN